MEKGAALPDKMGTLSEELLRISISWWVALVAGDETSRKAAVNAAARLRSMGVADPPNASEALAPYRVQAREALKSVRLQYWSLRLDRPSTDGQVQEAAHRRDLLSQYVLLGSPPAQPDAQALELYRSWLQKKQDGDPAADGALADLEAFAISAAVAAAERARPLPPKPDAKLENEYKYNLRLALDGVRGVQSASGAAAAARFVSELAGKITADARQRIDAQLMQEITADLSRGNTYDLAYSNYYKLLRTRNEALASGNAELAGWAQSYTYAFQQFLSAVDEGWAKSGAPGRDPRRDAAQRLLWEYQSAYWNRLGDGAEDAASLALLDSYAQQADLVRSMYPDLTPISNDLRISIVQDRVEKAAWFAYQTARDGQVPDQSQTLESALSRLRTIAGNNNPANLGDRWKSIGNSVLRRIFDNYLDTGGSGDSTISLIASTFGLNWDEWRRNEVNARWDTAMSLWKGQMLAKNEGFKALQKLLPFKENGYNLVRDAGREVLRSVDSAWWRSLAQNPGNDIERQALKEQEVRIREAVFSLVPPLQDSTDPADQAFLGKVRDLGAIRDAIAGTMQPVLQQLSGRLLAQPPQIDAAWDEWIARVLPVRGQLGDDWLTVIDGFLSQDDRNNLTELFRKTLAETLSAGGTEQSARLLNVLSDLVPKPEVGSPVIWPTTVPQAPNGDQYLPTLEQVAFMKGIWGIQEAGYGPKTKAKVWELQGELGVTPDSQGMIGPTTWGEIVRLWTEANSQTAWLHAFYGINEQGNGPSTKQRISELQAKYGISGELPPVTAGIGRRTQEALEQEHYRLVQDLWMKKENGEYHRYLADKYLALIGDSRVPAYIRARMQELHAAFEQAGVATGEWFKGLLRRDASTVNQQAELRSLAKRTVEEEDLELPVYRTYREHLPMLQSLYNQASLVAEKALMFDDYKLAKMLTAIDEGDFGALPQIEAEEPPTVSFYPDDRISADLVQRADEVLRFLKLYVMPPELLAYLELNRPGPTPKDEFYLSLGFTQEAINYFGHQRLKQLLIQGYNPTLVNFLNMRAKRAILSGERFDDLALNFVPKMFYLAFLHGVDSVTASNPDELASAILGDVAASSIIWGDIRDLGKEFLNSLSGEEVDWVNFALSAVGLASEVGWVVPIPDVMDYLNVSAAFLKAELKVVARQARMWITKGFFDVVHKQVVKVIGSGLKSIDKARLMLDIDSYKHLTAFISKHPEYQDEASYAMELLLEAFRKHPTRVDDQIRDAIAMVPQSGADVARMVDRMGTPEELAGVIRGLAQTTSEQKDYFSIAPDMRDWLLGKLERNEVWFNYETQRFEGAFSSTKKGFGTVTNWWETGQVDRIDGFLKNVVGSYSEDMAMETLKVQKNAVRLDIPDNVAVKGVDLVTQEADKMVLTEAKYSAGKLLKVENFYEDGVFNPKKYLLKLDQEKTYHLYTAAVSAQDQGNLVVRLFVNNEADTFGNVAETILEDIKRWNVQNPGLQVEVMERLVRTGAVQQLNLVPGI